MSQGEFFQQDGQQHIDPREPETVLNLLAHWADAGALRQLDRVLAQWAHDQAAKGDTLKVAHSAALLAIALLAHVEGQGHTSFALDELAAPAAWPASHRSELEHALSSLGAALREYWPALASAPPSMLWAAALAHFPSVQTLSVKGEDVPFFFEGLQNCTNAQQRPFVLAYSQNGALLTLRRYWQYEQDIAQALLGEHSFAQSFENAGFSSSQPKHLEHARVWLDGLFEPTSTTQVNWQKVACALALRGRVTLITGGPGTGKTYTAARVLALLLATHPAPAQLRIALAAPTGKAAARLKQSIDQALLALPEQVLQKPLGLTADAKNPLYLKDLIPNIAAARTLHSLLGFNPGQSRARHHAGAPLALDLLIVDEASMIHAQMMAALLAALPSTARLVILGDKDQLESVEAGAVLGQLCAHAVQGQYSGETAEFIAKISGEKIPENLLWKQKDSAAPALAQHTAMLRYSHRFGGPIGALAQAVNAGDVQAALAAFETPTPAAHPIAALHADTPALAVRLALGQWEKTPWKNHQKINNSKDSPQTWQPYLAALAQWPRVRLSAKDGHAAHVQAHAQWVRQVLDAFAQLRVLCVTRQGPWGVQSVAQALEEGIQNCLKNPEKFIDFAEDLPQKIFLQSDLMATQWWPGRAVMVTRNEPLLGVFNGDIGIALPAALTPEQCQALADNPRQAPGHVTLRVYFDTPAPTSSAENSQQNNAAAPLQHIATARLPHVQSAFAMTVHKSQGSEFAHTLLVLPPPEAARALLTRELLYTGITRAKRHFTLISAAPDALAAAIANPSARTSALSGFLSHGWVDVRESTYVL